MIETKFKQTELGLIPEDWEVKRLGEVAADIRTGKRNGNEQVDNGKYPFFVRSAEVYQINEYSYEGEAILIPGEGGIGKIFHYINGRFDYHQRVYKISEFGRNSGKYIYYYTSKFFGEYSKTLSVKATVDSLRLDAFKNFPICIPNTIAEQERIAAALSDVDELINSYDKLIAKKQAIKQGAMQQLLTGQQRLPGFSEPWIEKRLGDIGVCYSGLSGKTKDDFGKGNSLYVTFLNVLNNPVLNPNLFEKVHVLPTEKQNKVMRNDLFFNTSSETPDEVGICSVLLSDVPDLYLNSFCFGYRIKNDETYPLFLSYFFRCKKGRDLMSMLAQGVTRYNISKTAFIDSKILLPTSYAEQRAIATILSDMDGEIEAIKAKKEKYEKIKRGMMQQLLTGRIRLLSAPAQTDR